MAKITPFPLPSNPSHIIRFLAPTVADSLDFCSLRQDMEESATTEYLTQLQGGEVSDPALWTAQDRRTALWWIFVSVSDDTTLSYNYECQHCGERHYTDIDLVDLDDGVITLNAPPYVVGEVMCNDIPLPARFHPLDGRAVTHLEVKRLELDGLEENQAKRLKAEIKVLETVHSFTLDMHKDKTWEEATQLKLDMVMAMDRENEYRPLVAKCLLAAEELRHGLKTITKDGVVEVLSPPLRCESDQFKEGAEEQRPATVLLMRFRAHNFIPEI